MKGFLSVLVLIGITTTQSAVAQGAHKLTGLFYAPTPCDLREREQADGICAQVTVPVSVKFAFFSLGTQARTRKSHYRGVSGPDGRFEITLPRGTYMLTTYEALYVSDNKTIKVDGLVPVRRRIAIGAHRPQSIAIPMRLGTVSIQK
jgi:hypothetical protein